MKTCSFCGRPAETHASGLSLCSACRVQLQTLRPENAGYYWYVRAVRRALFGSAG